MMELLQRLERGKEGKTIINIYLSIVGESRVSLNKYHSGKYVPNLHLYTANLENTGKSLVLYLCM